jgi:PPOX class probable F420-dependent enzyme
VVSTYNENGSIHSALIWIALENDRAVSINSAVGRLWPTNLQRDPRVTLLVLEDSNPDNYIEIRGTADATTDDADEHIDRLSKKYIGQDEYPYRRSGEQRIKFVVTPTHVRHYRQ